MNLAIHGLKGDIRHGGHINSYYDDPHEAVGKFDFVLANQPFNVNAFIDTRYIYRQIDRAHRDWTDEQIGFIANIVRLYRGEAPDYTLGGEEAKTKLLDVFSSSPDKGRPEVGFYADIPGLCKAAPLAEIEAQGWSLNAGRYVGVAAGEEVSDEDFKEKLETLNEELEVLNAQARELEQTIARNIIEILDV